MNIVLALLVFSLIIFVHELGHFVAARKAGILVVEFSIGMGPRLLKFQPGETMYSLKLFPLGGSCQMLGEDEENESDRSFNSKSVYKRMAVILAGAFMNFVLAVVVAVLIVSFNRFPEAEIRGFTDVSPIAEAGALQGDRITRLNNTRINTHNDFWLYMMMTADGTPVAVELDRGGERFAISVTPVRSADDQRWMMGFQTSIGIGIFANAYDVMPDGSVVNVTTIEGVRRLSFAESVVTGVHEAVFAARTVFFVLGQLITGDFSLNMLMGPLGIVGAIGDGAAAGLEMGIGAAFWNTMQFVVLISVNLGVLNLLPLPALDGGRTVFLILEAIRRKPLKPEREGMVHLVGFALLMVLAVFVAYNDIVRLFFS